MRVAAEEATENEKEDDPPVGGRMRGDDTADKELYSISKKLAKQAKPEFPDTTAGLDFGDSKGMTQSHPSSKAATW